MATKKHISVNLRDLQRLLKQEEDELLNANTETNTKSTTSKSFDFKHSDNRWENEDNDDDFEIAAVPKAAPPEPDFSTIRNPPSNQSADPRPSPSQTAPAKSDDHWRSREPPASEDTNGSWRSAKPTTEKKMDNTEFLNAYNMGRHTKDTGQSSENTKEEKKLYVPRFRREVSPSPENDRFSCLNDNKSTKPTRVSKPRDSGVTHESSQRYAKSPPAERKISDDSDLEEKPSYHERNKHTKYNTESQGGPSEDKTKETGKKGLFVPSHRRNMKKEESMEDIFLKAGGVSIVHESEKAKKESYADKVKKAAKEKEMLDLKKNEVEKHNKLYECSQETVSLIEKYVLESIKSNKEEKLPELSETESIVPSVLVCIIVAKNCEDTKSMNQVQEKFKSVQKLLLHLTESQDSRKFLTELTKSLSNWGYPSLSESVYLVEAMFDSLYSLGVIKKDDFLEWLDNDVDDIPNRVTLLLQLMNWKRWLNGENLEEEPEDKSESESESESDEEYSDIEANVPKATRLPLGIKFK